MNNNEAGKNFELPPTAIEVGGNSGEMFEPLTLGPEAHVRPPVMTSKMPIDDGAVAVQNSASSQQSPGASLASDDSSMPAIADDNDLIEKDWVIKAKQIVAATKGDPYQQNYEIGKVRADYLKKRYGKDIKIGEA